MSKTLESHNIHKPKSPIPLRVPLTSQSRVYHRSMGLQIILANNVGNLQIKLETEQ